MRKLKAGIVGCGGIANGKHLPAMKKSGLYEIVAFCDIIRERAEKAKEEYGTEDAKVFEDYQELIKEDLDVVYVTTPNRSHAEISIAAMEAGKDGGDFRENRQNPEHRIPEPLPSRLPVSEGDVQG